MKDGWHGNEERIKSKREHTKKCKRNPKTRNLVCERWSHLYLCWSAASDSYSSSSVWYHFGCAVVFFSFLSINSSSLFYLCFVLVHWMCWANFFLASFGLMLDFSLHWQLVNALIRILFCSAGSCFSISVYECWKIVNTFWCLLQLCVNLEQKSKGNRKKELDDSSNNGIVHAFGDATQVITPS